VADIIEQNANRVMTVIISQRKCRVTLGSCHRSIRTAVKTVGQLEGRQSMSLELQSQTWNRQLLIGSVHMVQSLALAAFAFCTVVDFHPNGLG
jgi:hypothetical protein